MQFRLTHHISFSFVMKSVEATQIDGLGRTSKEGDQDNNNKTEFQHFLNKTVSVRFKSNFKVKCYEWPTVGVFLHWEFRPNASFKIKKVFSQIYFYFLFCWVLNWSETRFCHGHRDYSPFYLQSLLRLFMSTHKWKAVLFYWTGNNFWLLQTIPFSILKRKREQTFNLCARSVPSQLPLKKKWKKWLFFSFFLSLSSFLFLSFSSFFLSFSFVFIFMNSRRIEANSTSNTFSLTFKLSFPNKKRKQKLKTIQKRNCKSKSKWNSFLFPIW